MQLNVKDNFDIKSITTFKIGGILRKAYFPKSEEELVYLLRNLDDYILLGNCSNVLVSSLGYDGNVIFTTNLKEYTIKDTFVTVSCGVKGQLISQKVCEAGLSGFEFMTCFPGTIGGELFMNASAHGQCITDRLVGCNLYDKNTKKVIYKTKQELYFCYRTSFLQAKQHILLNAKFNLTKLEKNDIKVLMTKNLELRRKIQPSLAFPNAGSVFRNPENNSAGKLLDEIGAKSFEDENVKVWQSHANFIVNKGNATSVDVLRLMVKMKNAVMDKFSISLYPEIIFIGNKTQEEEELCQILYQKLQK